MGKSGLTFIISHYLAAGGLGAAGYIFGARVVGVRRFGSNWERVAVSAGLGLGLISQVVMVLGMLGWLNRGVVVGVFAGGLLLSHGIWREWVRQAIVWVKGAGLRVTGRGLGWVGVGVFLVWWFRRLWLLPLYPPTAFDATLYHLPLANLYARVGGLAYAEHIRVPVFPQNMEMLFALALIVYDDILAQLTQSLMLILAGCGLMGWGRRFGERGVGIWAVAYLALNPLIVWLAGAAYVDLGLMLFCFLACYGVEVWRREGEMWWLVLGAVFAGLAAGTKYTGLMVVAALMAVVGCSAWRRFGARGLWHFGGIFAAGAATVGAPWYLRNFHYTHNPIFPFLNPVFFRLFGAARWAVEHGMDLGIGTAVAGPAGFLTALWQAPWKLAFEPGSFFSESRLALPFFAAIPLLLVVGAVSKRVDWKWWMVYGYVVFVYLTAPQLRYLLPVLPLAAVMAGRVAESVVRRTPLDGSRRKLAVVAIILAVAVWPFVSRRPQFHPSEPLPVTGQQRDSYYSSIYPAYGAYQWLNRGRGGDYRLYAYGLDYMTYFARGVVMGDHFGPAAYRNIEERQRDSRALHGFLTGLGAEYFLVDDAPRLRSMNRDEYFAAHFEPVFSQGGVVLYRLLP